MPIVRRGQAKPETAKHKIDGDGIKKRIPAKSKLIYTSKEGVLVVRTPSVCMNWPMPFRMRLIPEYVTPRSLMAEEAYQRRFVDNGFQDQVYAVNGVQAMVKQPYQKLESGNHVVVLRTEVWNITTKEIMFLYHDEPAMRILMTYAFLYKKDIPGMPKLDIYGNQA